MWKTAAATEDHIALAGILVPVGIAGAGSDDQVVDAVAVDVSRSADRMATIVGGEESTAVDTIDLKTIVTIEIV